VVFLLPEVSCVPAPVVAPVRPIAGMSRHVLHWQQRCQLCAAAEGRLSVVAAWCSRVAVRPSPQSTAWSDNTVVVVQGQSGWGSSFECLCNEQWAAAQQRGWLVVVLASAAVAGPYERRCGWNPAVD
jgi:hypothetical protein